jgi:hypothetical protein
VTSEALVLAALGAIELVIWYSMLQVLPAEGGADGRCAQSVGGGSEIAASDGSDDGGWREGCDGHELSSPIDGMGHCRGWQPGSKVSMMIIRPPQQGQASHSLGRRTPTAAVARRGTAEAEGLMMVRRRDSSLGGTTRSPPASPSLPVILSNSCRFWDIRRNNAPGWLKLLGIAGADSTSMSRRVHSSLEQFFDKARKSGSHLTLRFWVPCFVRLSGVGSTHGGERY